MRYRPTPSAPRSRQWVGLLRELDVAEQHRRGCRPWSRRAGRAARRGCLAKEPNGVAGDLVAFAGLLVGVEDDDAAIAVDDDLVAAGDVGEEPAQADDGGDFEHAGHDGGVAGPAAGLGGEGVDHLRIEDGRLARRQVVGQDDDRRLAGLRQVLAARPSEMLQDRSSRCRTGRRCGC